jgi:hypothetical protein
VKHVLGKNRLASNLTQMYMLSSETGYNWKVPELITNGTDVGTNSDEFYMQIKQNKRSFYSQGEDDHLKPSEEKRRENVIGKFRTKITTLHTLDIRRGP